MVLLSYMIKREKRHWHSFEIWGVWKPECELCVWFNVTEVTWCLWCYGPKHGCKFFSARSEPPSLNIANSLFLNPCYCKLPELSTFYFFSQERKKGETRNRPTSTLAHTHTHTHMHTHMHTHTHTHCVHEHCACMHTRTHTHTAHAWTHCARMHTCTRTHTHTHARMEIAVGTNENFSRF